MSERRCPSCSGLVGPDVQWCGQCFARLDEPAVPHGSNLSASQASALETEDVMADGSSPGSAVTRTIARPRQSGASAVPVRGTGEAVVWACPKCDLENPLEESICPRCGARFADLFDENAEVDTPAVEPGRALILSLMFPGMGHMAQNRTAEGVSRAVIFLWALGSALAIMFMRKGLGAGPFLPMLLVLLAAAAAVYGLTAADAKRLAEQRPPIISSRTMLYATTGLILLVVVMFSLVGFQSAPIPPR